MKMLELIREIEDAIDEYEENRPDDEQGTTREWNLFNKFTVKRLENAVANAKAEAKRLDEQQDN